MTFNEPLSVGIKAKDGHQKTNTRLNGIAVEIGW